MSTAHRPRITRKEEVLAILRQAGRPTTAEEIIRRYDLENQDQEVTERVRFGKEVHGTLSTLYSEGVVQRAGIVINPASGAEVYSYVLESVARGPREKISKGYKERCEELETLLKKETERANWLAQRSDRQISEIASLKAQLAGAM